MVQMKPGEVTQPAVPNVIYQGQKSDNPSRPQGIIDSNAIDLYTCGSAASRSWGKMRGG
jgi:hypothetical protein